MKAFIVVDMQVGMLHGSPPPRGVEDVVVRINALARRIRDVGGYVVWIQHHGQPGDGFAPGESGWPLLPSLELDEKDAVIAKSICDAFYGTQLDKYLRGKRVEEVLICGWATDFCVDTTIRAASSRDYKITVVSDAHVAADRPHLSAADVIQHHNSTWPMMIVPDGPIQVKSAEQIGQLLDQCPRGV